MIKYSRERNPLVVLKYAIGVVIPVKELNSTVKVVSYHL